jgi:putative tryptophan/tyrosine transport system substrate-binding protein
MIPRREFVMGLVSAAAWPVEARGQQARVWRLGALETTSQTMNSANYNILREALRDFGYVEGQNLVIEYRSADGRDERFPQLAAELVSMKVDLILARGTPATVAARNASGAIPIVMTSTADPFAVVGNIARPGGNVTGMASLLVDLTSKRLALLAEIVPGLARVGILSNPDNPNYPRTRKNYETAAQSLGMQLVLLDVRTPEDIAAAFAAAGRQRLDALSAATETVTQANRSLIAGLATEHRLPAVYGSREFVDAGGLIAYGVSYPDLYRRAALFVDKIFKGAKPAELPVEQPTRFELIVNLKAARGIGLTIPETFLARADEVIE